MRQCGTVQPQCNLMILFSLVMSQWTIVLCFFMQHLHFWSYVIVVAYDVK